jgi:hypothetical protein
MKLKSPANIDVAVLMLFFNRPETFQQVFAEVKKARPSKLFLYQDGPRDENDMAGVEACRKIASDENIDWECEVHRNYQSKNYGCDPSEYIAQKWAFSIVDKCIVLEDDDVPSQSFFPYCKEMLDRYENDERIMMIQGLNVEEESKDVPYDYFFSSMFCILGWASWRRVIDKWDATYSFLDDEYNMKQLKALIKQRGYRRRMLKSFRDHKDSGKEFYETIYWASMLFNSGLSIVPTRNLINNIGFSTGTHPYGMLRTMPHRVRRMFSMKRFELDFPLRHPRYVIENVKYKERFYIVYGWNKWVKVANSLEELWLNIKVGNFKRIIEAVKHRVKVWCGAYKFG